MTIFESFKVESVQILKQPEAEFLEEIQIKDLHKT